MGHVCVQENYGKDDEAAVSQIKALYKELNLEQVFADYEKESYENLTAQIEAQQQLPKAVFTLLLKKIYKRTK